MNWYPHCFVSGQPTGSSAYINNFLWHVNGLGPLSVHGSDVLTWTLSLIGARNSLPLRRRVR